MPVDTAIEDIRLEPITDDDLPFLRRVYGSSREDEMKLTGWPKNEVESFLDMQFDLQHKYYTSVYKEAVFQKVIWRGRAAGRLYLHRSRVEFRIVDIALLTEFRGKGIGFRLMKSVMDEAAAKDLPVTLHVERFNPALHFYYRLGFTLVSDEGVYFKMEWRPGEREQVVMPPAV